MNTLDVINLENLSFDVRITAVVKFNQGIGVSKIKFIKLK